MVILLKFLLMIYYIFKMPMQALNLILEIVLNLTNFIHICQLGMYIILIKGMNFNEDDMVKKFIKQYKFLILYCFIILYAIFVVFLFPLFIVVFYN